MLKVLVDYPSPPEEFVIVERMVGAVDAVQSVIGTAELSALQAATQDVYVDPALIEYAVRIATATRDLASVNLKDLARFVSYGASPRASINMILAGQALALIRGRDYALAGDVTALAADVLRHRLVLSYEALAEDVMPDHIIGRVLQAIPAPEVTPHVEGRQDSGEQQWMPRPR
jgi:MoxR-like ATPase